MPEEFDWRVQRTKKDDNREIIMGIRKDLEGREEWTEEEGILIREVRWKGEKRRVGMVYVRGR